MKVWMELVAPKERLWNKALSVCLAGDEGWRPIVQKKPRLAPEEL